MINQSHILILDPFSHKMMVQTMLSKLGLRFNLVNALNR